MSNVYEPRGTYNLSELLERRKVCTFSFLSERNEITRLIERLRDEGYFRGRIGWLNYQLSTLAAVEFGLTRLAVEEYSVAEFELPLPVFANDVRLAIAKYDTTDTKPCQTAERLINGELHDTDIFLFTGDLEKYRILVGGLPTEEGLDILFDRLEPRLNDASFVISDLVRGKWSQFQLFIWRLRLKVIQEASGAQLQINEIDEEIIKFARNWGPSTFFSSLTPSPVVPSPTQD